LSQKHGEGGSEQVRFRPLFEKELLDMSVEQFLASLRFPQRGKLDDIELEIDENELISGR